MLYFITFPDWDGHWHKYYNHAVCTELQKYGIEYKKIITDYSSQDIKDKLEELQYIRSSNKDIWLFSMAQNPAVELVGHKPGRKYGHINSLSCFPFEPAVLQGIDLQDNKFFGYYDRLFLSSSWSYKNAATYYPQHAEKFVLTGFPIDFEVYEPYLNIPKIEKLVVFNQRFSWERLPLIEIELAGRLISIGYEVLHLYAPINGKISSCHQLKRLQAIGEKVGIRFIANYTKSEYHMHLAKANIVITTSICDNLPMSLIEAIFLGAVPVAPKAMCFTEFVNEDNLYRPYDLEDIIRIVLEQPKRHHNIGQYDKRRVIEKYLKLMELK